LALESRDALVVERLVLSVSRLRFLILGHRCVGVGLRRLDRRGVGGPRLRRGR
jgi:hypothetical protein